MSDLKGKVALVTGVAAKRSMGHGVALRFAAEGANVVLLDRYSAPESHFSGDKGWKGLDSIVAEIKAMGREALPVIADINNNQEVEKAVNKGIEKFGKIDSLVHCAAIRGPMATPLVDLDEKIWRNVVDVDLTGAFIVAKAVATSMIDKGEGGKIVLISSVAANRGVPGSGSYCAAKWGVLGLMKTLALELAKYRINVNVINPGSFGTQLRDGNYAEMAKAEGITLDEITEKYNRQIVAKIPLGRMGVPEDIANAAFYLVSDQGSYVTGQAIDICGGWGMPQ